MKRNEIIVLLVCLVLLLVYLVLDLADAAKPLTQFVLSPVGFVCMIFRFSAASRVLDVDTAGVSQTAARLLAFAAVQTWFCLPVIVHSRVHSKATAVFQWSALSVAALGFGFYLFWFVAFALM